MASRVTARLLRRGLQVFALGSLVGVVGLLVYSGAWMSTVEAVLRVNPWWALAALAVASLDWFGGGLRLWILTRHVHPEAPYLGMVKAGGLNTWASYLTPSQTGGGPVMIYTMKRHGVPIPEAMTASLMTFVATVVFFAVVGPAAIVAGAGRSLEQHDIPLVQLTFLDLFMASAGVFLLIGLLMLLVILAPGLTARFFHSVIGWLERHRGEAWARRVEGLRAGVDRMHECVVAYFRTWRGWAAMAAGIVTSALAHANKLVAGYLVLRALGLDANVVDILLVQTTIVFLLYFAPTPGGSGAAEALSAALMSVYVPLPLLPAYTILWRFAMSYATVGFGSFVFYRLIRGRLDEAVEELPVPDAA